LGKNGEIRLLSEKNFLMEFSLSQLVKRALDTVL
jgi:hypothetical protein